MYDVIVEALNKILTDSPYVFVSPGGRDAIYTEDAADVLALWLVSTVQAMAGTEDANAAATVAMGMMNGIIPVPLPGDDG